MLVVSAGALLGGCQMAATAELCGSSTLSVMTLKLLENWKTVFLAAIGLRHLMTVAEVFLKSQDLV